MPQVPGLALVLKAGSYNVKFRTLTSPGCSQNLYNLAEIVTLFDYSGLGGATRQKDEVVFAAGFCWDGFEGWAVWVGE